MIHNDSDNNAVAGAVSEIAKASQKGLEITAAVAGFLKQVLGESLIELGGVLTDRAKLFRYENLLTIADRVEAINRQRSNESKTVVPLPLGLGIPLIESASLADKEPIQRLWARLIASATDPESAAQVRPSFVDIIRQLEPDEALLLQGVANHCRKKHYWKSDILSQTLREPAEEAPEFVTAPIGVVTLPSTPEEALRLKWVETLQVVLSRPEDSDHYLDNLLRLRLLEIVQTNRYEIGRRSRRFVEMVSEGTAPHVPDVILTAIHTATLRLTEFGAAFLQVCMESEQSTA